MVLALQRPLVYLDLETTGIDPHVDKIVEICLERHEPAGQIQTLTRRVDPQRPIPHSATAIHGITDADVADSPTFAELADELLEFLDSADLAGFNIVRFDAPLLAREFTECGRDLQLDERQMVDVMTIYHRKERRDLSAAVQFYLGRTHDGAHSAAADVRATAEILAAQLAKYPDLPGDVTELQHWLMGDNLDRQGKFAWDDGVVVFTFGKHRGKALAKIAREDREYCRWLLGADFPDDTKSLVDRALQGTLPSRASRS